ncbi:MAG: hypothetical protein IJP29_01365 [Lachnospiraceae bacterium]|nr:hypothetical protein [Lachnospiraceae bacterium]
MKFRYFLRGFGIGIVFATIICMVAFQNDDSRNFSDKEVIERAKELGMVEQKESIEDIFASEGDKDTKKESNKATEDASSEDNSTTGEKSDSSEEETTKDKTAKEQTTKKTTEKKTTENTTEKTTEKMTEEVTTEKVTEEPKNKTVTITIKGGMSSYPVCQKLEELGVIEDASDFDNYLIRNGYANRISVGTHTLRIGMTYEQIAVAISDPA